MNDTAAPLDRLVVEHLDGWTDETPSALDPTTICWFDVPVSAA